MSSARRWGRRAIAAMTVAAVVGLAACTGTEGQDDATTAEEGMVPYLNFGGFGGGANPQANYNPYTPTTRLSAVDYVYETLFVINDYTCEEVPWLATEYEWVDDRTVDLTMRDGVTWNDGEAFDAEDVVFTFQMLKEYPALDEQGVWRVLEDVVASDDGTVRMTFTEPGLAFFTQIAVVKIVPEHIWSAVEDPVTFTNSEAPVGTGPMTVQSFNGQQLVIERNPDHWNADEIRVQEIRFSKADDGGQVDQLKLIRGDYDMNAMFIPNIDEVYVAEDPENNHYWFPAGSPISLYLNLEMAPFDDVAFRQAIAQAINRDEIIERAQQGYVDAASQTGLVLPGQSDWLPEQYADGAYVGFDVDSAAADLDAAGYTTDSQGRRLDADGQPMTFELIVPGGWNDWVIAAEVIRDNLAEVGIGVDVQTPTPEVVTQDRLRGNYEMTFGVRGGSCHMLRNFAEPLGSASTAPIGEETTPSGQPVTNEVRWVDEETDALLEELRVATDPEDQRAAVAGLTEIMVEEMPYIQLWYGANWFQYSTRNAVGWPSEDDPYAKPSNMLLVLQNLRPASTGD
ncbi:extracellular solute-binding protein family 5 [Beutenbergia cavernae DSM 12333]|uniref:Extracellular solute-binding protein family 5 n=1 Tax=Beutenbergia cavernae (strain ATCC BAA-8 / DSM 12333 / CCUG 43141 / JCM 11478 / NBRC 16432 / NCIMB 13614 / HKI 0122) TaxID=471853 RepID=C5C217_BEUC1|nr:ABC transporter substrate-binding protein [Beutenbergia cavernae]ACQ81642.1 extracellular solute-binding protein family 5 [Beutenbergia cavernae DSM 12333]